MVKVDGNNVVLRNGINVPLVGFGTWMPTDEEKSKIEEAVELALDIGYRHIDTAFQYRIEKGVGIAIKKWLMKSPDNKREDLFITTKLPMAGMTPEGVHKYSELSLKALDTGYIDLYLIHAPVGVKGDENNLYSIVDGKVNLDYSTDLIAIWKEMEKLVSSGKVKSIGVSNFDVRQMRKIDAISSIPMVTNQVEMSVYCQRKDIHEYCKENNIVITSYTSLGNLGRSKQTNVKFDDPHTVLSDPVVLVIAEKHKVTPAQVLLKFLIQLTVLVIPKSVTPARIKSNFDLFSFELSEIEMAALVSLDKNQISFTAKTFPGIIDHPEVPDFLK